MGRVVELRVDGKSQAWQRAGKGSGGQFYTKAETREYEAKLGWEFKRQVRGPYPIFGKGVPVSVTLAFRLRRPRRNKSEYPTGRPDWDNFAKSVCDALGGGLAWHDDSQVVRALVVLEWAIDRPHMTLFATEMRGVPS